MGCSIVLNIAVVALVLNGAYASLPSVADVLQQTAELSTFFSAIQSAGLLSNLQGEGPFTVFAPANSAFDKLPMTKYKWAYLMDSKHQSVLQDVVKYHIGQGKVSAYSLSEDERIPTLLSEPLFARVNETGPGQYAVVDETCGHGNIVKANIAASNGYVQIVDGVLLPTGRICPDTLFFVEQRGQSRVSGIGYDCRRKGSVLVAAGEEKPVGLTSDTSTKQLFWSNDQSNTAYDSWLTTAPFDGSNETVLFNTQLQDPQGLDADLLHRKLYFTERLGNMVSSSNYDATDRQMFLSTDTDMMPTDIAVDGVAGIVFVTIQKKFNDTAGILIRQNLDGTGYKVLKTGLVKNYGVCVDTYRQHLYYVQGGNGGSLSCLAYGDIPCDVEHKPVYSRFIYPFMCSVDNTWAPYNGPTYIAVSETNFPGAVKLVHSNGTMVGELVSGISVAMGVSFGCQGAKGN